MSGFRASAPRPNDRAAGRSHQMPWPIKTAGSPADSDLVGAASSAAGRDGWRQPPACTHTDATCVSCFGWRNGQERWFHIHVLWHMNVSPGGGRTPSTAPSPRLFAVGRHRWLSTLIDAIGKVADTTRPLTTRLIRQFGPSVKEKFLDQSKSVQAWVAKLVKAMAAQVTRPSTSGRVPAPTKARQ